MVRALEQCLQALPPAKSSANGKRSSRDASVALCGRDVTGGDLLFVRGEGRQDFALLALRNLSEIQAPSEFRGDLIELGWGDLQIAVGLLKAKRSLARLGGRELERPARNLGDPQRPHEFE